MVGKGAENGSKWRASDRENEAWQLRKREGRGEDRAGRASGCGAPLRASGPAQWGVPEHRLIFWGPTELDFPAKLHESRRGEVEPGMNKAVNSKSGATVSYQCSSSEQQLSLEGRGE